MGRGFHLWPKADLSSKTNRQVALLKQLCLRLANHVFFLRRRSQYEESWELVVSSPLKTCNLKWHNADLDTGQGPNVPLHELSGQSHSECARHASFPYFSSHFLIASPILRHPLHSACFRWAGRKAPATAAASNKDPHLGRGQFSTCLPSMLESGIQKQKRMKQNAPPPPPQHMQAHILSSPSPPGSGEALYGGLGPRVWVGVHYPWPLVLCSSMI